MIQLTYLKIEESDILLLPELTNQSHCVPELFEAPTFIHLVLCLEWIFPPVKQTTNMCLFSNLDNLSLVFQAGTAENVSLS